MKKNKWKIICLAVLCGLLFLIGCFQHIESKYRMEVVRVEDNGYGYKIHEGKRTIIVQPFIPVVSGKRSFKTHEDAQNVGYLVLKRIELGKDFSVTKDDLKQLNVCLSD